MKLAPSSRLLRTCGLGLSAVLSCTVARPALSADDLSLPSAGEQQHADPVLPDLETLNYRLANSDPNKPKTLVFPDIHGIRVDTTLNPGLVLVSDDEPVANHTEERKRLLKAIAPDVAKTFSSDDDLKALGVVFYVKGWAGSGLWSMMPSESCDLYRNTPNTCTPVKLTSFTGAVKAGIDQAERNLREHDGVYVNSSLRQGVATMTIDTGKVMHSKDVLSNPVLKANPGILLDMTLQVYAVAYATAYLSSHPTEQYVSIIQNIITPDGKNESVDIRPAARFLVARPPVTLTAQQTILSIRENVSRSIHLTPWFQLVLKKGL